MARQATGTIVEHRGKDGRTYRALRFSAYGRRRFVSLGPVTARQAEADLRHLLADVERGTWQPPTAPEPAPEPVAVPTFHQLSEAWWMRHAPRLTEGTRIDYKGRLERHLIPYFGDMPIEAITFDTVEDYIAAKLARAKPMSPRYINMTVTLLGAILEGAVERGTIARNPAKGKARRLEEPRPSRSYLRTAAQITALLDAAGELDREAPAYRGHVERRGMIAVLAFAGLRISELLGVRWRDVDLAGGWLHIGESKTDAGVRDVKIRGALRDELVGVRQRAASIDPAAYVFPTATGRRLGPDNFRNRVLGRPAVVVDGEERAGTGAVGCANKRLEAEGLPPLPGGITPHSLRRTFASVLYALGEDPGVVMDEMGHTDPGLALRIYRQSMRRGEDEKAALRALVEGAQLADIGIRGENEAAAMTQSKAA
jgi:integrase